MDGFTEKHIDTSRGFHYRYYTSQHGTSSKYTLLLLHGWPDSAQLYKKVVPSFQKMDIRVIVPDLLGYGGTSKPTTPESFEIRGMVQDQVELLKQEGVAGNIIPAGHDWGSYIAQRFYFLKPEMCAGLITLQVSVMPPRTDAFDLDTFNNYTESTIGYPLYAYWEFFLPVEGSQQMEKHLESLWHALHGEEDEWMKKLFCTRGAIKDFIENDKRVDKLKPYGQDEEVKNEWIADKEKGGLVSPCCWYRAMAGNHQREAEGKLATYKIEKPYLFIGSDGDAVCRTDFVEVPKQAGMLSDVEVHELHAGHWTPYEKPEEVGKIMAAWLETKGFVGS